jgi:hypothetical protein
MISVPIVGPDSWIGAEVCGVTLRATIASGAW